MQVAGVVANHSCCFFTNRVDRTGQIPSPYRVVDTPSNNRAGAKLGALAAIRSGTCAGVSHSFDLNSRYQGMHESRLITTLNITVFGEKIGIVTGIPPVVAGCSEARNVLC